MDRQKTQFFDMSHTIQREQIPIREGTTRPRRATSMLIKNNMFLDR